MVVNLVFENLRGSGQLVVNLVFENLRGSGKMVVNLVLSRNEAVVIWWSPRQRLTLNVLQNPAN